MVPVPSVRAVRVASMLAVLLVPTMMFLLLPATVYAQHEGHLPPPPAGLESNLVLNGIEIITGLAAAAVAFQAALAYREGRLGKGMTWVAIGMIVMSVGHLILVVRREGVDPLGFLGPVGSYVAFSVAVFISFLASAWGFWTIRKAAMSR
jgi:hypothetical protein